MMVARRPTQPEMADLKEILAWGFSRDGKTVAEFERETAHDIAESAAIAVFDGYQLYPEVFPGYTDKVMVVIWADYPGLCDVYVWGPHGIEEIDLCWHDREKRARDKR